MDISQIDRSNYYRGLLVLSGRDRIIDTRERELMLRLGRILDFETRFCEAAINDLLDNKFITDEPVLFSDREIAECFLHDAVRLAFVDGQIHTREKTWLSAVATANGFTSDWLDAEVQRCLEGGSVDLSATLAIQKHIT